MHRLLPTILFAALLVGCGAPGASSAAPTAVAQLPLTPTPAPTSQPAPAQTAPTSTPVPPIPSPVPTSAPTLTPAPSVSPTPAHFDVDPSQVVLHPADLDGAYLVSTEYPLTNAEIARRYGDSQSRFELLEQQGREIGYYMLLRAANPGAAVSAIEMTAVRYATAQGAGEGFRLNASTIGEFLPHFRAEPAPDLADEALAWSYELADGTLLREIMLRQANYVLDVTIVGSREQITPERVQAYARRLHESLLQAG